MGTKSDLDRGLDGPVDITNGPIIQGIRFRKTVLSAFARPAFPKQGTIVKTAYFDTDHVHAATMFANHF
jgi:hypothetical protein